MSAPSRRVAIVGLGRVGLPLALYLATRGHEVQGIETNRETLRRIQDRQMPFLEEGGPETLSAELGRRFHASADLGVVGGVDVILITLGTPVDEFNNPIFTPIENLLRDMAPHLHAGQLILLRSTVAPGTTERMGRLVERQTGLVVGKSVFLAFCPERIAEGLALTELPEVPQIVGGVDPASTEQAARFFQDITAQVHRIDARSAELAKLFCNMYRYIDFAVGNEFMMIADQHERDIYPILHVVNSGYARAGLKSPGLTGGPCLYKDGFFLTDRIPYNELISGAWKIHETVPAYLVDRVDQLKPLDGAKAAVLGLTFKRNIDDTRNSLSFKIRRLLLSKGAEVRLHDPFVDSDPLEEALSDADAVFFAMNHDAYVELSLDDLAKRVKPDAVLCDVWNLLGTGKIVFRLAESPRRIAPSRS